MRCDPLFLISSLSRSIPKWVASAGCLLAEIGSPHLALNAPNFTLCWEKLRVQVQPIGILSSLRTTSSSRSSQQRLDRLRRPHNLLGTSRPLDPSRSRRWPCATRLVDWDSSKSARNVPDHHQPAAFAARSLERRPRGDGIAAPPTTSKGARQALASTVSSQACLLRSANTRIGSATRRFPTWSHS